MKGTLSNMCNRIKVESINKAMRYFEKSVQYIDRKIDERSQNGRTNEDSNVAVSHLKHTDSDGNRCWSF